MPGQGGGAGRPAGGPGHAAPGGRRPGEPYQGPGEPAGQFDGGYATVIRASDSPVRPARRPGSGRPADSARPQDPARPGEAPADVFVYRDPDGQPARVPGENDPSYWYDLTGTGSEGPGAPAEETPHVIEKTRGPFEPLVSSADPPGTVRGSAAGPAAVGPEVAGPEVAGPASQDDVPAARDERQDMAHAHARKLEQIKDLYLTAEAIGEANVDKHFDQLLAQQRELISEYFRQSSSAAPAHDAADQAGDGPGASGDPAPPAGGSGFPAGAPENDRVAADQPRAW